MILLAIQEERFYHVILFFTVFVVMLKISLLLRRVVITLKQVTHKFQKAYGKSLLTIRETCTFFCLLIRPEIKKEFRSYLHNVVCGSFMSIPFPNGISHSIHFEAKQDFHKFFFCFIFFFFNFLNFFIFLINCF